jgi:hypothetical protein
VSLRIITCRQNCFRLPQHRSSHHFPYIRVHNPVLAKRNVADCGVDVVDPWAA